MLDRHLTVLALQALRNRFPSLEVLAGAANEPMGRMPLADGSQLAVLPVDDGFVVWLGERTPGWCATAGLLAELLGELQTQQQGPALNRAQAQWLRRLMSRTGTWVLNETDSAVA